MRKKYKIVFLPIFKDDLKEIIDYITFTLENPFAANALLNSIESAIEKRATCPLSFEPYISSKDRDNEYYRIYVKKFIIFYVVLDDVMEVRRIIYSGRNLDSIV